MVILANSSGSGCVVICNLESVLLLIKYFETTLPGTLKGIEQSRRPDKTFGQFSKNMTNVRFYLSLPPGI